MLGLPSRYLRIRCHHTPCFPLGPGQKTDFHRIVQRVLLLLWHFDFQTVFVGYLIPPVIVESPQRIIWAACQAGRWVGLGIRGIRGLLRVRGGRVGGEGRTVGKTLFKGVYS